MLRPKVVQKESPRLGSTICYGQELAGKSHQDSAVRLVTPPYDLFTSTSWPDRATKIRQYDLIRPNVGQKEPPRLGSKLCNGEELSRKSHQDSAVRFVMVKTWPERATKTRQYALLRPRVGQKELRDSAVQFVTAKRGPEAAIKTRQYDLLRPNVGQKEPPRLGSTICYGQELARKSHRDSARRFVTAKSWPERATKTRQYDLIQPRVGQKKPPRLSSTIYYGQTWARKSHQDSAVRFVLAKRRPEKSTETRQYDLLRPRFGQKEPPRIGSTLCYGHELGRKNYETRQYNLLRLTLVQKESPRLGSTTCYGQELARKSPYDLLRHRVVQKEPPKLVNSICYGQTWDRKSQQDSAVRLVTPPYHLFTATSWPERATETRQYDL